MTDVTRSPYLGPHVVGQRIVVRRILDETGPTGGPAFTDVLGTCTGWDPCVVLTEAGESVTIPLDRIVSGKPVPPRPSVRLRVSVADAEAHVAGLWPSLEAAPLGDWTLRRTPATTRRRANSCLAVGDPGVGLEAALARVGEFYAGSTPLLHVEADSDTEAALLAAGCAPATTGEADFLLGGVSGIRRRLGRPVRPAELSVSGTRAVASIGSGCDPVAEASATVEGDWIGLTGLEVDPSHRRQGLAHSVLASLLEWGAEQGATTAWLHVETGNAPALSLYESLGLLVHHRMRYLTYIQSP